jgi:hypothetical protein
MVVWVGKDIRTFCRTSRYLHSWVGLYDWWVFFADPWVVMTEPVKMLSRIVLTILWFINGYKLRHNMSLSLLNLNHPTCHKKA